jgi:hypothetical protein
MGKELVAAKEVLTRVKGNLKGGSIDIVLRTYPKSWKPELVRGIFLPQVKASVDFSDRL